MGRGRGFSPLEDQLLLENYSRMTIAELEELFAANGYKRSRKSINRKLEKMREEGDVGFRRKETIKRSYRQRMRRSTRLAPTKLVEGEDSQEDTGRDAWDTGENGWDTGGSPWDTGD